MKRTTMQCNYCKIEFQAKRTDSKFCSGACKQQAYLERKSQYSFIPSQEKSSEKQHSHKETSRIDNSEGSFNSIQSFEGLKDVFKAKEPSVLMDSQLVNAADAFLRDCITQLMEFEQENETRTYKALWLFKNAIKQYNEYCQTSLRRYYIHWAVLENLITKMKSWYNSLKDSEERTVKISLSEELIATFTDVLSKI